MKIKYLKLKNWLLLSMMSLLGLSACHCHKGGMRGSSNNESQIMPLYGTPAGDMRVGRADTGAPAGDIRVGATDSIADAKSTKAAEQPQPREPQVAVYGVPTIDYSVKGRVVDAAGRPIKGMQVVLVNSEIDPDNLPDNEFWRERMKQMADTSDAQGNFEVRGSDRPWGNVRVLVRDIDGAENGTYGNEVFDVDFAEPENQPSDKPSNNWNLGERKADITVKMKREK